MRNLAIIPARSGSKGLPDKNIRLLNGKPLIGYAIAAANASGAFETVLVSTDSERYADEARRLGAEVPFLRSAENSTDTASSWSVAREALERLLSGGRSFDTFMLLQPTSPFREPSDIVGALALLERRGADGVVSVCEADHSPLWCNTLPEDGSLGNFRNKKYAGMRRQDLPTYYRVNGAIYLFRTSYFLSGGDPYGDRCYAYAMDKGKSIDIDDALDFKFAEAILRGEESLS
jgi:CMP-N,N'-diacetyllegionaminic acid synthase